MKMFIIVVILLSGTIIVACTTVRTMQIIEIELLLPESLEFSLVYHNESINYEQSTTNYIRHWQTDSYKPFKNHLSIIEQKLYLSSIRIIDDYHTELLQAEIKKCKNHEVTGPQPIKISGYSASKIRLVCISKEGKGEFIDQVLLIDGFISYTITSRFKARIVQSDDKWGNLLEWAEFVAFNSLSKQIVNESIIIKSMSSKH